MILQQFIINQRSKSVGIIGLTFAIVDNSVLFTWIRFVYLWFPTRRHLNHARNTVSECADTDRFICIFNTNLAIKIVLNMTVIIIFSVGIFSVLLQPLNFYHNNIHIGSASIFVKMRLPVTTFMNFEFT